MTDNQGWQPPASPAAGAGGISPWAAPTSPAPAAQQVPAWQQQQHTPGWTPPPKPGLIPLHPLSFGTIIGSSFRVMRRNPGPTFGMAVRGWTIVGGDIMATRDFTTTASDGGNGQTTVTTHLVLFHKPAP